MELKLQLPLHIPLLYLCPTTTRGDIRWNLSYSYRYTSLLHFCAQQLQQGILDGIKVTVTVTHPSYILVPNNYKRGY